MSARQRGASAAYAIARRTAPLTLDDLLEVVDATGLLENVVEPRDLNKPAHVVGEELILDDPLGKLVPFVLVADEVQRIGSAIVQKARRNGAQDSPAVDTDAILDHLVLALLQIRDDLYEDEGKEGGGQWGDDEAPRRRRAYPW